MITLSPKEKKIELSLTIKKKEKDLW